MSPNLSLTSCDFNLWLPYSESRLFHAIALQTNCANVVIDWLTADMWWLIDWQLTCGDWLIDGWHVVIDWLAADMWWLIDWRLTCGDWLIGGWHVVIDWLMADMWCIEWLAADMWWLIDWRLTCDVLSDWQLSCCADRCWRSRHSCVSLTTMSHILTSTVCRVARHHRMAWTGTQCVVRRSPIAPSTSSWCRHLCCLVCGFTFRCWHSQAALRLLDFQPGKSTSKQHAGPRNQLDLWLSWYLWQFQVVCFSVAALSHWSSYHLVLRISSSDFDSSSCKYLMLWYYCMWCMSFQYQVILCLLHNITWFHDLILWLCDLNLIPGLKFTWCVTGCGLTAMCESYVNGKETKVELSESCCCSLCIAGVLSRDVRKT